MEILIGVGAVCGVLMFLVAIAWRVMIWAPGRPAGAWPTFTSEHQELTARLKQDLTTLAVEIGERNVSHRYQELCAAAEFLAQSLREAGYEVHRDHLQAHGKDVCNVWAERRGSLKADEVVIVGAHYDTIPGTPGANDNGSAVIATLALARYFADQSTARTLRFVFFVNEEFPYYMTPAMGSLFHAEACRRRDEKVVGMFSLETIGYYSEEPGSQGYPSRLLAWIYPDRGDFVAVIGNIASRGFVHEVARGLTTASIPFRAMAAPSVLKDIFRSDHAAFWRQGYPAAMVTDTANFRYVHYHTAEDTIDKIQFEKLALVVTGMTAVLLRLAGDESN